MCERCEQLEAKIQRYRSFIAQGLDDLTVERIKELIKELARLRLRPTRHVKKVAPVAG
jgi:hypothetical protein